MKGMCSVTFRKIDLSELIARAKEANLEAIEWGADIHAPSDDLIRIEKIGILSRSHGLKTPSYGSYFRGDSEEDFVHVSNAALWLGAKTIRVWAGNKDSEEFTKEEYDRLVSVMKQCGKLCAERRQILCFEYHYGTYCNSAESTLRLLNEIDMENVRTYWQPMYWIKNERFERNCESIRLLGDRIENVHVYHWNGFERFPLREGSSEWKNYIRLLGKDHGYFLEFVRDDSKENFMEDAEVLSLLLQ